MSCPTTHAKNVNQCPGLVLLEGMQKRHTSEQKQADDEHAEQERLEQEATHQRTIKYISNIMDQSAQREEHTRTHPPQPRSRLCVVHNTSLSAVRASHEAEGNQTGAAQDLEMQWSEEKGIDSEEELPDDLYCELSHRSQGSF